MRRRAIAFALVFVAALGVRLLCWYDARFEALKVQSAVTENYKHLARLLLENGAASFFDPATTTSDPDLLGHPPGYSILLSLIYAAFGEGDAPVQIFQVVCDSIAAALVLLLACELLPFGVAATAAALVALAPQFCWNSVLLLPDTLAVPPVLLAVYLLTRAGRAHEPSTGETQGLSTVETHEPSKRRVLLRAKGRVPLQEKWRVLLQTFAAGVLVGVSCWLRANALLLAPFMLLLVPFVFARGMRLRPSLSLLAGAVLAIAPLTLRNEVVFGHFIPVSLGAGQTLVEGIADYDAGRRFGLPDTDVELTRMEAAEHGRPDYASSLFTPDGYARDRERTARALAVIGSHPFWFASVMARRAASMLRLERTPLASTLAVSEGTTHVPRLVVRAAQKLFVTALDLPLVLLGLLLFALKRQRRALAALLVVPLYYFCVQSALHTEYRYVLVVHYFLFVPAGAALYHLARGARRRLRPLRT